MSDLDRSVELRLKKISGHLPTSEYDLMNGEIQIGMLQLRHRQSHAKDVPASMASHIYYEIEPAHRGQGYGKIILRLGLEEAKKIGLREVILTCLEDNLPSKKIIEANGGELLEAQMLPNRDKRLLKYRIAL